MEDETRVNKADRLSACDPVSTTPRIPVAPIRLQHGGAFHLSGNQFLRVTPIGGLLRINDNLRRVTRGIDGLPSPTAGQTVDTANDLTQTVVFAKMYISASAEAWPYGQTPGAGAVQGHRRECVCCNFGGMAAAARLP